MSLISWWHAQWVSGDVVRPDIRWDQQRREFHLNSPAGHLTFVVPDQGAVKALTQFRDHYINVFERLGKGAWIRTGWRRYWGPAAYFLLYADILGEPYNNRGMVRYEGNLRTRVRLWWRRVAWFGWMVILERLTTVGEGEHEG